MQPKQNMNKGLIIKIIAGIAVLVVTGISLVKATSTPSVEQAIDTSPATTTDQSIDSITDTKVDTTTPKPTTPTPTKPSDNTTPIADNRKYKDGTYTATGTYRSPAGNEPGSFTLVIKDDTVVSASYTGQSSNSTSIKFQTLFKAGFNSYVVGKKIDSLTLQVVNGSSLTPKGFIDALGKIKIEASNA